MPTLIRRVLLRALAQRPATIDNRKPARPNLCLEALEDRTVPAVYDVYAIDPANGTNSGKVFVDGVETVLPSAYDPADYPTPPPANNYTLINDAFAALQDNNSDQIVLHGTFDWSAGAAFDSWVLGSDGVADTGDDYSIFVQPGLNGVTVTAAAPVNGVYGAVIKGPGDVPEVDAEAFLYFGFEDPGLTNQDWTISNLQIEGFDGAIAMYNVEGGPADAYSGTTITNNKISVPADADDDGDPDTDDDTGGNTGILVGAGTNQTISNNTILIAGTGASGNGLTQSVGIEIPTAGGSTYNNLVISGNTIRVTGSHNKAGAEVVIGVLDNSFASTSKITVTGNAFFGSQGDRATSLERGFRISAHSSGSTTVEYSDNVVQGANVGFQWTADGDFDGAAPIEFTGNAISGTETGVLLQSNGVVDFNRNTVTNNTTGVRVETGSVTAVTNNTVTGNGTGISIGADAGTIGPVENNNLSGNAGLALVNASPAVVDATDNWWGSTNPAVIAAMHSGNVTDTGFETAPLGPSFFSPASARFNTTAPAPFTVVASAPNTTFTVAGGLPPGFSLTTNTGTGTATLATNGTPAAGTFTFTIVADSGSGPAARQTFTLTVVTPPTFTSGALTTFTRGTAGTFTVTTAAGVPAGTTLALTGALPPGVSFNAGTGVLSGTPTVAGVYQLTFTASNGPNSSTTQTFTLVVVGAASFGPVSIPTLTVGVPMAPVTVTTGAAPVATIGTTNSLTPSVPGLPPGLTLTDNGDGTATISGTPTAPGTTAGITLTASNVYGSVTSAAFSVTVFQTPVFTTGPTANFVRGVQNVRPVRVAAGFPAATNFAATLPNGARLPTWIRLVKVSNTQANLIATPPAGFAGPMNVRVVATNGQRTAVQIITVRAFNRAAPAFVAFSVPTVTVGVAMTPVTVRTSGFPFAAITSIGAALPAGLTLTNNGNGTATISGTPTGPGGVRGGLKLRATNALGTAVSATFSITVNQAPTFLSPTSGSFTAGTPGTFVVNTSGFPRPTILRTSGVLPTGMTFTNNGNGTATFATSAATPAGIYVFDLQATNGVLPSVTQILTLTIA